MEAETLLSLPIEHVVKLCDDLARREPELLVELYHAVNQRVERLEAIHSANFERFCEENPLRQYWGGLCFFDTEAQEREHRQLCDALHYMKKALQGDARERILIKRKLKKAGFRDYDRDLPLFRLKQMAEQHSVSI